MGSIGSFPLYWPGTPVDLESALRFMLHMSHASPLLREKGEQLGKEGQEKLHRGDGEVAVWLKGESLSGKDEAT
jgi:hypothetical protein